VAGEVVVRVLLGSCRHMRRWGAPSNGQCRQTWTLGVRRMRCVRCVRWLAGAVGSRRGGRGVG
jgi:hypothetical protein